MPYSAAARVLQSRAHGLGAAARARGRARAAAVARRRGRAGLGLGRARARDQREHGHAERGGRDDDLQADEPVAAAVQLDVDVLLRVLDVLAWRPRARASGAALPYTLAPSAYRLLSSSMLMFSSVSLMYSPGARARAPQARRYPIPWRHNPTLT